MGYPGFLIRMERLNRNWSQEGLCKGICTVSYLSKIEQGKADPSEEILRMIFSRMDLRWYETDPASEQTISRGYELLESLEYDKLQSLLEGEDSSRYLLSDLGADWLLLNHCLQGEPLPEELERFLTNRQLAFQRSLQHLDEQALGLYPAAYIYCTAGSRSCYRGESAAALELLQTAYDLAAREGRPLIMLYSRMHMGNCYSNLGNLTAMEASYRIAARLAESLGKENDLRTIRYNVAASQLEAGEYEKALAYFETLDPLDRLSGHKLAICYEKLGRPSDAAAALDRSEVSGAGDTIEGTLLTLMRSVVRCRLENPAYLQDQSYGELLIRCFDECRERLPAGYALFHLPWMLEWFEANRRYKDALALLRSFPEQTINY